jgi:predicted transcriptional regulator
MLLTMLHMCRYGHAMVDPLDPRTLQAARVAAGLSRADLAKASSVSETTIMRIEKGEVDPRLAGTWAALVRALPASAAA